MVQEKSTLLTGRPRPRDEFGDRFLIRAAFGGGSSPHHVSQALVDVAEAALAGAHRQVRANALRLTGMEADRPSLTPSLRRLVALQTLGEALATLPERRTGRPVQGAPV